MPEQLQESQKDLDGWHQVAEELHTYPLALQEIAKGHLEKRGYEISPEHHQSHIDIARPAVPNIDSLPPEEQDFVGEIIEIGGEALENAGLASDTETHNSDRRFESAKKAYQLAAELLPTKQNYKVEPPSSNSERWLLDRLVQDVDVAKVYGEVNMQKALAATWNILGAFAESGSFESPETTFKSMMWLLKQSREQLKTQDQETFASSSAENRDIISFLSAAEHAYAKDFNSAHQQLESLQTQPALKTLLKKELQEAEQQLRPNSNIDKTTSTNNLEALIGDKGSDIPSEKLQEANIGITVGTSLDTLSAMLTSPYGRYLTSHEHDVVGGGGVVQHGGYESYRAKVERELGHDENIFIPRPVYGALTSDLQADRASGYGAVTIYPKPELAKSPGVVYAYGDTVNAKEGINSEHGSTVAISDRRLAVDDAQIAYSHSLDHKKVANQIDQRLVYIEAQLPGLEVDDIEKVSINAKNKPDDVKRAQEITEQLLDRGIKVEHVVSWSDIAPGVGRRIQSGMNEEDVYSTLKQIVLGDRVVDPRVSLVINAPLPGETISTQINRNTLNEMGITVREPLVAK
ncbi:MAG: hypothetical protein WBK76_01930 [Candidatus Saccharimonadales bacterium]